jgi:hypothetical protein
MVVSSSHQAQARPPRGVVILKGEGFPAAQRAMMLCSSTWRNAAPDLYGHVRYRIYELPVIEEREEKSP